MWERGATYSIIVMLVMHAGHANVHTLTCTHIHKGTRAHTNARTHAPQTHEHTHERALARTHTHTHARTHARTRAHIHTHTYTHTRARATEQPHGQTISSGPQNETVIVLIGTMVKSSCPNLGQHSEVVLLPGTVG